MASNEDSDGKKHEASERTRQEDSASDFKIWLWESGKSTNDTFKEVRTYLCSATTISLVENLIPELSCENSNSWPALW